MSQKRVYVEGRPDWKGEGPASASASDPVAMLGRLSVPGLTPAGGAGPVERRLITEAERAIRAEARPSPIASRPATAAARAWNGGFQPPEQSAVVQEEPVVSEPPADYADPIRVPLEDPLSGLVDAVVEAIEAREAKVVADTAWQVAQRALAAAWRAMPPLDLLDDAARPDKVEPAVGAPVRPTAEGGRATAEQLQRSRKRGQANMQAQRRAVELTSAAAAKAETQPDPPPMPPFLRRMLDALVEANGDRTAAATKLGIKRTSLIGTLGKLRSRTDLTERERGLITAKRS